MSDLLFIVSLSNVLLEFSGLGIEDVKNLLQDLLLVISKIAKQQQHNKTSF
jgi:hypothetical protein